MLAKQTKFILAIALQVAIILLIILFKVSVLKNGTEIILRVEPVDPRDPLRGDYVVFRFKDISEPNLHYVNREYFNKDDSVYVVLREHKDYWTVKNVQKIRPSDKEVFIKGKVIRGNTDAHFEIVPKKPFVESSIRVNYGIEEYFIPEGKGQGFSFQNKEAVAKAVVDDKGNAVLKQIYVDRKPWP